MREYDRVRRRSVAICAPLAPDDYGVQPMADASPPKWHLAHTTWFFETFVLKPFEAGFEPFHPRFEYLFNSYYNTVGEQYPRARRGLMSRPTLDEVRAYRAQIDARMVALIDSGAAPAERVVLGLAHEEQHQELMLTDVKYNLGNNPLRPPYSIDLAADDGADERPLTWLSFDAGVRSIGLPSGSGIDRGSFRFDNETPAHDVHMRAFELASRPVTNGEFLAFIEDGGYRRPELWLSDGWQRCKQDNWGAPLYWWHDGRRWLHYTLAGPRPLVATAPVCHVSFYEADAYARWAGARLPSEFEWEAAALERPCSGNFYESAHLHPSAVPCGDPARLFGDVWEWTASPYGAYPGFAAGEGALGEYNGKFMCNQMVLRGGSALTAAAHVRPTYRNFFYPPDRWQMSGFRLARDDA